MYPVSVIENAQYPERIGAGQQEQARVSYAILVIHGKVLLRHYTDLLRE